MATSYPVLTAATVLPALLLYSRFTYSAIIVQSLKSLAIKRSLMSEGKRRRNMAMKVVPGLSSVGNRAFICCISSVGFMSPISGYFNNSKALVQRALVHLDTSKAFISLYASGAASSMSLMLSVMLVQASVGRAVSRWSNLVDELEMLQILNFPSSWQNQVSGSCGRGGQNDDRLPYTST